MTTVLRLIQDFCEEKSLPVPAAVMGSQEKSIRQLRALLQAVINDLAEFRWQQQRILTTWASNGLENQGVLTTLFGAGYSGLVSGTLWDVTTKLRIHGPLTEQEWQAQETLGVNAPPYQAWISQNQLYISPAIPATDSLSAVYITNYLVTDVLGLTPKPRFTADDDSIILPDNVVLRGLKYKWKEAKGEAGWEDDYNTFTGLVAKNLARDSAPKLALDNSTPAIGPGIIIPAGNWNV